MMALAVTLMGMLTLFLLCLQLTLDRNRAVTIVVPPAAASSGSTLLAFLLLLIVLALIMRLV